MLSRMPYSNLTHDAVEFFLAVRDVTIANKLGDVRDHWGRSLVGVANGQQIMNIMEPQRQSFAFYWLETRRDDIKLLNEVVLIGQSRRHVGPLGYGDDEEFFLTVDALRLIEGRNRDEIRHAAIRYINRALGINWVDEYDQAT